MGSDDVTIIKIKGKGYWKMVTIVTNVVSLRHSFPPDT